MTPQRRLSATPLTDGGNGLYFAHILANPANANQLPDKVEVVNQTDVPPTIKDVDRSSTQCRGTAIYDEAPRAPNLHVVAKSSDQLGGTTPVAALSVPTDAAGNPLTDTGSTIAQALTPQADGTQTWDFTVKAPPATVLVLSKQGGTVALPVDVSTAPDNPAGPLKAVAGADQSIADGPLEPASVSLNGSASTGDIASYEWTGPYAVDAGGVLTRAPDPALGAAPNKVATGLYDATVAPPDRGRHIRLPPDRDGRRRTTQRQRRRHGPDGHGQPRPQPRRSSPPSGRHTGPTRRAGRSTAPTTSSPATRSPLTTARARAGS